MPKITKKDEVVTERAYIVCLCIAGACLLGCLFCFLRILGGGEDDNSSIGITFFVLLVVAMLFVLVPLGFEEDAPTSSNAPRIDPKTITAVAAVYTAYQVRKIREELRDTSDSGGGDSGGGDS